MAVQIETVAYGGWSQCTRLFNDEIEVIVTNQVGPRIIRCAFIGGPNLFCERPEEMGQTGGDSFRLYGGHRLWTAPEHKPRTYYPDNEPVTVTLHAMGAAFTSPIETTTRLQKTLSVMLHPTRAQVRINHSIINHHALAVTFAPWALSVMRAGGTAIVPLPDSSTHEGALPSFTLNAWAYTDMADPRWTWGERYILLRQETDAKSQKIGVWTDQGWLAFVGENTLFIKTFPFDANATYPDHNSPTEVFTNHQFTELETLAPLRTLEPGAAADHEETWHLVRDIATPHNDADVVSVILPHIPPHITNRSHE